MTDKNVMRMKTTGIKQIIEIKQIEIKQIEIISMNENENKRQK